MSATPEQPSTGDTTCPYPSAHTHVVTATVLESFRTGDLAAFCQERGIVPEELLAWRTAFVAAGVAGLHEALHPGGWLQVNLQLDPFGVSWTELISDDFQEYIRAWLEEGHIDRFFYLHKPPGVRLRFRGARARFLPLLEGRLTTLMRKGVVAGSDIVPYDAEVYQFGGAAGLELAHEYFTYESLAVLAYHRLRLQGAVVLPPAEFSLVLV
ncbi:MAG: thiopeptide-type bacteriocin biosynthesis protein, partial [Chloroflexi bacterium]|nr:thiopeptide-type bacteriocin biosynthesis protein [Chloroflexota bacterium]